MSIRSQLGRMAGMTPADEGQLRAMRAAIWHEDGDFVCLRLSEVRNDITRLAIQQEAERQFGKREIKP